MQYIITGHFKFKNVCDIMKSLGSLYEYLARLAQGRVKHHICKMQLQNGIQMSAGFL